MPGPVRLPGRRARSCEVAVVTGAGSGIGRATAVLLARQGAKVHLADISPEGLQETAALLRAEGATAVTHVVDVAEAVQVEALADAVFEEDGAVDLLHNNAGIGVGGRFVDLTLEDIDRMVTINLLGTLYGLHHFLPRMLEQDRPGHVVNTASGAGLVPIPFLGTYSATKHGVVAITETLHAEHADGRVGFSVVCPGVVDTPILRNSPQRGGLVDVARVDRLAQRFAARMSDLAGLHPAGVTTSSPGSRAWSGCSRRGGGADRELLADRARRGGGGLRPATSSPPGTATCPASPETVAAAVWDAYANRKVVVVVAPLFVTPAWLVRRLSTRASLLSGRIAASSATRLLGVRPGERSPA